MKWKRIRRWGSKVGCLAKVFNCSMWVVKSITFKLLMVITCTPITGINISNLLTPASLSHRLKHMKRGQLAGKVNLDFFCVCSSGTNVDVDTHSLVSWHFFKWVKCLKMQILPVMKRRGPARNRPSWDMGNMVLLSPQNVLRWEGELCFYFQMSFKSIPKQTILACPKKGFTKLLFI